MARTVETRLPVKNLANISPFILEFGVFQDQRVVIRDVKPTSIVAQSNSLEVSICDVKRDNWETRWVTLFTPRYCKDFFGVRTW